MENLEAIDAVREKIKTASRKAIQALHLFVFEEEGDRWNRKRLRAFSGFTFEDDSAQFRAKLEYVEETLTAADQTAICNILGVDYAGTVDEVRIRICRSLIDLNSLIQNDDENDDDNNDGQDDVQNEADDDQQDDGQNSVHDDRQNDVHNEADGDRQDDGQNRARRDRQNDGRNRAHGDRHADQRNATYNDRRDNNARSHFSLSYRDIENTIKSFDGADGYPVSQWIRDFEDSAILFGWNDMQMFVFARGALTGLAKLFINGERGVKSWNDLKTALREEFSTEINNAQLHAMLAKRKMTKDETVRQYFLHMKELAARGDVDAPSLISHVINGIQDNENNKIMLYGASSLQVFKERLRVYEDVRNKRSDSDSFNRNARYGSARGHSRDESTRRPEFHRDGVIPEKRTIPAKKETTRKPGDIICYNCGDSGHVSKDCKSKPLGVKCFKCNQFGHRAFECKDKQTGKSSDVNNITASVNNKMCKNILVNDVKLEALIDTGSHVTLIRNIAYGRIGSPSFKYNSIRLTGFGRNEVKTLGSFLQVVNVDDQDFELKIHVVPDSAMPMDVIIGSDISEQAQIKVDQDGVFVSKNINSFIANIDIKPESNIEISHIPDEKVRKDVAKVIDSYQPVKNKTTNIEMKLIVEDNRPIYSKPRRLPLTERRIVDEQVEEWLKEGIVEECSSDYASPVVVVRKKDGSPRVCIDYRKVNQVIVKDRYPMPLIDDQLDVLRDAKIFSTIDLKNGFFHVAMEKESQKYTTFTTYNGQYKFLRVPFGLCNSPAVFQRFINQVFRKLIKDGIVFPYLDDIIIPARDFNEALERLKLVFQTASEYNLSINFKKCQFLQSHVEYLGHVIGHGEVRPSPDKTIAVRRFPTPKSLKDIQSFLGLTGYFRKFIYQYSVIAKPLSDLLRKDSAFKFEQEEQDAFERLKSALASSPVLKIYRQEDETELHTDASKEGYGAVLLQKSDKDGLLHPVYFMSKKTTPAERNYSSYELEVLAIVEALKKFRVYLLGTPFKVVTDCSAFEKTMQKKDLVTRVARWVLLLSEYNYKIEHRPGSRMMHVDALSRYPVMAIVANNVIPTIKKAQDEDGETRVIVEILKDRDFEDYFIRNGILFKFKDGRELLVVPRAMQNEVIRTAHEKGHFATQRTVEAIRQDYFVPELTNKVERYIANCIHCIVTNRKSGKQEGFLNPLNKEPIPLYVYHVDHLGPLQSTSKNYNHILAVIDGFTKFTWLYPVKSTTTREVLTKLDGQKRIFGNPGHIVSDRGTAFTSQDFANYCEGEKIKHTLITTGLPRSNGQVERLNRTIIPVLAKLSIDEPTKWYRHVDKLQRIINSTYHRSIGTTPFELLFGTKMRDSSDVSLFRELIEEEIKGQFQTERDDLRHRAKDQICKVQEENRRTYNLRRRESVKYKIGDLVAIKRTQLGPGLKLKPKYLGPYRIKKIKFHNSYDVVRVGGHEGPLETSTCAEFMKPWTTADGLSGADNM